MIALVTPSLASEAGARLGFVGLWRAVPPYLGALAAAVMVTPAWPALGRVLFAYGLAARIPVALVMLAAMMAGLGTHYDAVPRNFPAMGPGANWLVLGLFPQATYWLGFTVVMGMLFGVLAVAALPRAALKPPRA